MGKAEAKGLASPDPCVRDAAEPDQPWHSGSAACAGNPEPDAGDQDSAPGRRTGGPGGTGEKDPGQNCG